MNERKRLTTYLAGAIEHATDKEMVSWRDELKEKINSPDLLIYDPVAQESMKVGKPSGQQVEYIKGLKRGGKWDLFYQEMWKIWFGQISPNTDIVPLLTALRMRKHVDGNRPEDLKYWGDSEAVIRSDFIVVYMPSKVKTIGTIFELVWAFMYRIPIYLILPDAPKTETNSSLLFGTMISNGEVFYSVNDCAKYIKETHKLQIPETDKKEKE
jgi:hypothetical protein